MTRTAARAPMGTRATVTAPRTFPGTTTTIAALTTAGMSAALVVRGSVDRVTVAPYQEQVRGPTLRPGQVVVLDHLQAHHTGRIRVMVASFGCEVVYVPRYSPADSPIELAISSSNTQVRRLTACTPRQAGACTGDRPGPRHTRTRQSVCCALRVSLLCEDQLFCS